MEWLEELILINFDLSQVSLNQLNYAMPLITRLVLSTRSPSTQLVVDSRISTWSRCPASSSPTSVYVKIGLFRSQWSHSRGSKDPEPVKVADLSGPRKPVLIQSLNEIGDEEAKEFGRWSRRETNSLTSLKIGNGSVKSEGCKVTDKGCNDIARLGSLEELDIAGNDLSVEGIAILSRLHNLRELRVDPPSAAAPVHQSSSEESLLKGSQ